MAVDHTQLERLWDVRTTAMLMDMMLPIYPSIVLSEMARGSDKLIILLSCKQWDGRVVEDNGGYLCRLWLSCVQGGVRGPGCDRVVLAGPNVQHRVPEK